MPPRPRRRRSGVEGPASLTAAEGGPESGGGQTRCGADRHPESPWQKEAIADYAARGIDAMAMELIRESARNPWTCSPPRPILPAIAR